MESYNYGIKEETTMRLVGGAETKNGLVPHSHVVDKHQEGYAAARGPSSTQGPPAKVSSVQKIGPHNFWLQIPVGIELVEDRNCWSLGQFLLNGPCTDSLPLSSSVGAAD